MALFDKKQSLGKGGSMGGMPSSSKKAPSSKEPAKPGTSFFGGKGSMDKNSFLFNVKRNEGIYKKTGLGADQRAKLGKIITDKMTPGRYNIGESDLKNVKGELDKGQYGKFKDLSRDEREKMKKLVRGFEK